MKRLLLASLSIAILFSASALSQTQSPERLAEQYDAALKSGDWKRASLLMHSNALSRLKELVGPLVTSRPVDLGKRIFNVRTRREFDALSEVEVFERMMTALTKNSPSLLPTLASAEAVPIGQIKEGKDLVHIIFRVRNAEKSLVSSDVMIRTVKREGKEWRMMLPNHLEGVIAWWTDAARPSVGDLDRIESNQ